MSDDTKSVPPSERTQQEDKAEDAIHEQAAKELPPEPEVVSIEDIFPEEEEPDVEIIRPIIKWPGERPE